MMGLNCVNLSFPSSGANPHPTHARVKEGEGFCDGDKRILRRMLPEGVGRAGVDA